MCVYLAFRYNVLICGVGAKEGRERRGHKNRIRSDKAAQVTAWDDDVLRLHDQSVHGVEAVPGQPHGALLLQKRSSLKTQGQGCATVSQQVKPEDTDRNLSLNYFIHL